MHSTGELRRIKAGDLVSAGVKWGGRPPAGHRAGEVRCPSIKAPRIPWFASDGVGAVWHTRDNVGAAELECFHVFYGTAGLSWHVVGTR